MGRAPCCDKANVKKGPWSPEEDTKLKDYIEKCGTGGNWISLPQKAGLKRCGKSCRLRWLNYLRPNIKHGEFSDEEDRIIYTLYSSIGSRWSIIAAQLPGRTDNDIKNYWNTKLKKKHITLNNNNNNNLDQKKYHDHHDNQYHMISSLSSPAVSVSSPATYQYTNTTCYNSLNTMRTMSFTGEGIYSTYDKTTQQSTSTNSCSTILQSSALTMPCSYHQQPLVKDCNTLLSFCRDQTSRSSSDGSCSINRRAVKCEDDRMQQIHGLHIHQEEKKPSTDVANNDNNGELWGQISQSSSLLEYGLEEIKQLISTNINVGKEEENSKMMYYY